MAKVVPTRTFGLAGIALWAIHEQRADNEGWRRDRGSDAGAHSKPLLGHRLGWREANHAGWRRILSRIDHVERGGRWR